MNIPDVPGPLDHVPDPADRYQVFGSVDNNDSPWIEITDTEAREGMRIDLLSALKVAGDISRQAAYVIEQMMARHLNEDADQERWYRDLWEHESR